MPKLEDVRIYPTEPTVEDKSERGEASATRVDTIRYQFEQPGDYELPAIEFTWWDAASTSFKKERIEGQKIKITGLATTHEQLDDEARESSYLLPLAVTFAGISIGIVALRKPVSKWIAGTQFAEAREMRALEEACRSNNAQSAYATLLSWRREHERELNSLAASGCETSSNFEAAWQGLSKSVFGRTATESPKWTGERLWNSFQQVRRELTDRSRIRTRVNPLPDLNPTISSSDYQTVEQ